MKINSFTVRDFLKRRVAPYLEPCKPWLGRFWDFAGINIGMARHHFERHNYRDAAFRYGLAAWWQPESVEAWAGMGMARGALGEFEEAEKALKRALALEPENAPAREAMQSVRQMRRQAEQARKP